jgi:hypothetical protein
LGQIALAGLGYPADNAGVTRQPDAAYGFIAFA